MANRFRPSVSHVARSLTGVALILVSLMTTSCTQSSSTPHELMLMPLEQLPTDMQQAPERTQQAYQFTAANPDAARQIPCFCGCVKDGHKSTFDCYVRGVASDGTLLFNDHALGCQICVDITQDVMRQLKQGDSLTAIHDTIQTTYSKYGPSTGP